MQGKQSAIVATREKHFREKEDITSKMIFYGLWQSDKEVEDKLNEIPTIKEKLLALKSQINFRKVVLEQPVSNKALFSFSSKAEGTYNVVRLKENVKALVRASCMMSSQAKDNPGCMLVGQRVYHICENPDGTFSWYLGKVISQVPGFLDWFNIIYDDDASVYTFKLLEDMTAGDLKIEIVGQDV